MGAEKFLLIAVTAPEAIPGEADALTRLLESGAVDMVHLRKPGFTRGEMLSLLGAIPVHFYSRIRLHDHFSLAESLPLGGVHVNSRSPEAPDGVKSVSRPAHSLEDLAGFDGFAYTMLSPVFDSISKEGYRSRFPLSGLKEALVGRNVVALGGVTPASFRALRQAGFMGAAMLGYLWQNYTPESLDARIRCVRMMRDDRFSLQFVTNGDDAVSTVRQGLAALEGGCRWIQVRMKDSSDAEVESAVLALAPECRRRGAILLLDDRVELASRLGVDGVHLGKDDMSPAEARELLGQDAIIGSTANSFDDIVSASAATDYFGVGPYRFTTTKKRLAPLLGLDGYRELTSLKRESGDVRPVVAIGGIAAPDVDMLLSAGVDGVAVSGAIAAAPDMAAATQTLLTEISRHKI